MAALVAGRVQHAHQWPGRMGAVLFILLRLGLPEVDLPQRVCPARLCSETNLGDAFIDLVKIESQHRLPHRTGLHAASRAHHREEHVPRRGAFGLIATWGSVFASDHAHAEAASVSPVVDETGLMTTFTKKHLETVLKTVEKDTQLKLRVICPPNGLQRDREAFREYVQPIKEAWGANAYSLVIVAENRINPRTGRALPLLTIQPGFRLQEKFQYRLTQDYLQATADRFGFPPTVNKEGTDACLLRATENVAALLLALADTQNTRYVQPLSPQEVDANLKRHGLTPLAMD
mmetsp:Transcript_16191/g.36272  ORF Transcript_16191/g.36272 Transcript_16191/m.36272 type:complete len:290 (-) Transcript_16191:40-909(-)